MKTFYAVFVSVILTLIAITMAIRSESTNFYGIADAKEIILNSEASVEIKKIRVVQGQAVKAGDTLIELSSQDLDMKISSIAHDLDEIKTRKTTHATMFKADIRQLKAQQQERSTELKAEIQQLESEYELNRKLVSQLKSIKKDEVGTEGDSANPLVIKINNLKKELSRILDSSQIYVDQLRGQLSYTGEPLADQVKGLEAALNLLMDQKNKLYISAQISGIIGTVNFKDGEKVSPYTAIATLHTESPSYIRGYIHENVYSKVTVGQKVTVVSLAENGAVVTGEIVGVGSRIVEYPIRLRKIPDIQMWGREITIKIPEVNQFLLGEKVLISLQIKRSFISRLIAYNPLSSNACNKIYGFFLVKNANPEGVAYNPINKTFTTCDNRSLRSSQI
jgi:multidrug resistance efflux pump